MPNTYTELRSTTVGTATASVTFDLTGISGYTDLVIVASGVGTGDIDVSARFNGDSGANYSRTMMGGYAGSAQSSRSTGLTFFRLTWVAYWESTGRSAAIANIMNYSNSTTFKTVLGRANNANQGVDAQVSLWRNTAAITSIELFTTAFNFAVGSTFSLYGIANADQGAAKATGGIITEDSTYWYHTFGASGAFIPKQSLTCDILQVAGGGAGGGSYSGGGGGAGGLLYFASQSLTAISHNVTVGAGGAGGSRNYQSNNTNNGNNSQFASLTASVGGGAGGVVTTYVAGKNGGSGGGAGGEASGATGGLASPSGQGNNGGSGFNGGGGTGRGGGGGGAGAVGANSSTTGGAGGAGVNTYASWLTTTGVGVSGYIAGGGGGSAEAGTAGAGGLGGGGAGAVGSGVNGVANTGGGGGSGGGTTPTNGGAGGSGVVIVRYAK